MFIDMKIKSFLFTPFCLHLSYFFFFSIIGFFGLKASTTKSFINLRNIDLYFTSVSAITVSSMSTIEMENFSNFQLILLTSLIMLGGDVFVSIIKLVMSKSCIDYKTNEVFVKVTNFETKCDQNHVELGLVNANASHEKTKSVHKENDCMIRANSVKCLCYTIIGYFVVVHLLGSSSIALYLQSSPSAKLVLENKGINMATFSIFATVSSFTNCGFIPTNENMIVFKKNSGLLLILMPQLFVGATLYPVCIMLVILMLEFVTKKAEFRYILHNYREFGGHLMSKRRACFLGMTVLGFLVVQFVVFVAMEWNSGVMDGIDWYEKVVASLFQVANTRHAGENVFDLSAISSAVLVLFVLMMYLPSSTSFAPIEEEEKEVLIIDNKKRFPTNKKKKFLQSLLLSQASYLAIFIILICITERHNLKDDPLNFNVFNIVIEVISAYGNVGYTVGYSCKRQVKNGGLCKDTSYGFVGRWSDKGKLILIVVMFFGKLKNFHGGGGTAWKL